MNTKTLYPFPCYTIKKEGDQYIIENKIQIGAVLLKQSKKIIPCVKLGIKNPDTELVVVPVQLKPENHKIFLKKVNNIKTDLEIEKAVNIDMYIEFAMLSTTKRKKSVKLIETQLTSQSPSHIILCDRINSSGKVVFNYIYKNKTTLANGKLLASGTNPSVESLYLIDRNMKLYVLLLENGKMKLEIFSF